MELAFQLIFFYSLQKNTTRNTRVGLRLVGRTNMKYKMLTDCFIFRQTQMATQSKTVTSKVKRNSVKELSIDIKVIDRVISFLFWSIPRDMTTIRFVLILNYNKTLDF
ncbi:hypothetical protein HanPI659440_Chr16g0655741 [Helianthus annuus]|nr:hypothetical protein HanPI659440_Chr16g0655741 [Helianthus annuus]